MLDVPEQKLVSEDGFIDSLYSVSDPMSFCTRLVLLLSRIASGSEISKRTKRRWSLTVFVITGTIDTLVRMWYDWRIYLVSHGTHSSGCSQSSVPGASPHLGATVLHQTQQRCCKHTVRSNSIAWREHARASLELVGGRGSCVDLPQRISAVVLRGSSHYTRGGPRPARRRTQCEQTNVTKC